MKFTKIKTHYLKFIMGAAYLLTILCVNTACMGPSYQPNLPSAAKKFKYKYE